MKSDMNHPAADRLEAFVEGVLDPADRAVLESHLLGCPECQTAVEEWRALFSALEGLPQYEPGPGFADAVMARVRAVAPARAPALNLQVAQAALQKQAARAGAALDRVLPKTTFGWAMTAAFLALPFLLGALLVSWLMSHSYVTPTTLWAFLSEQAVAGVRSFGSTVATAVMQTGAAEWLLVQGTEFVMRAGAAGVGMLIAATGALTMLSIWILYRNLFRTPRRDTHYATYSF